MNVNVNVNVKVNESLEPKRSVGSTDGQWTAGYLSIGRLGTTAPTKPSIDGREVGDKVIL